MDSQIFNTLSPDEQLDYIYHHCRLIDFEIVSERIHRYGICLYYDEHFFIEIRFDGLQGDRIKEVNTYQQIQDLVRWYERVDLKDLLAHSFQ